MQIDLHCYGSCSQCVDHSLFNAVTHRCKKRFYVFYFCHLFIYVFFTFFVQVFYFVFIFRLTHVDLQDRA